MDMEVNSKLFTEEEWENMKYLTNIAFLKVSTSEKTNISYEELEALDKHLDEHKKDLKENPIAQPIWPADYKFPLKLTYGEYLDLMLKDENLENTMQQLQQMMQQMKGQGQGQGKGKGNGDGQGQGQNGDEDGSGQGKMSAEDIDNLRKQFSDTDEEKNQDEIKEADAQDKAEAGDSGDEEGNGNGGEAGAEGGDEDGFVSGDNRFGANGCHCPSNAGKYPGSNGGARPRPDFAVKRPISYHPHGRRRPAGLPRPVRPFWQNGTIHGCGRMALLSRFLPRFPDRTILSSGAASWPSSDRPDKERG